MHTFLHSGRIHTMHATLELFLIRLLTVYHSPRPRMETYTTTMRSRISRDNDYLAVHVLVNHILDLCTQTGRLLGGLHQRSIYSRQRYV